MSRLSICVVLLMLFGTLLAEEQVWRNNEPLQNTARFGFPFFEDIRRTFCRTVCMSADTMPYFTNIMCAVKCPELYLPHGTSTPRSTTSTTTSSTTEMTTESTRTTNTTPSSKTPTTSTTPSTTTTTTTTSTTPSSTTSTMSSMTTTTMMSPAMAG